MSEALVGNADELGFDAARLARIARFFEQRYIASGKLPHLQILIARDGKVVFTSAAGVARDDGTPIREDAIYRIASMTKPLTSVAFMLLLEEGLVSLDQPVASVIPEFAKLGVYAGGGGGVGFAPVGRAEPMRMVDLLRHTSGLSYGFLNRSNVDAAYRERRIGTPGSPLDSDGFVAALGELPLDFQPGSAWNYSLSTDVLGVVVARLAGKSLGDVFRERITGPLGMVDTGFTCPENKRDRLTDAWMLHPQHGRAVADRAQTSRWLTPPAMESGGGGLVSTIADYHRFCSMLLGGGVLEGVRLLSPKTIALMTANHLPGGADLASAGRFTFQDAGAAGTGFGLGFAITLDPAATLMPGSAGEYYWSGMYSTGFFIDPVERLSAVFMTQLLPSGTHPIRRELKALVYAALTTSYA